MEITLKQLAEITIVSIAGPIDALTAPEMSTTLSSQIAAGQPYLVLDLGQVSFMSSAGLRVILGALKECRQAGGDLRLAAAQPGIAKILKMSGFTNILKAYPAVDEAVASYPNQGRG
jgi:anti-sigma B factor antagonist